MNVKSHGISVAFLLFYKHVYPTTISASSCVTGSAHKFFPRIKGYHFYFVWRDVGSFWFEKFFITQRIS